MKVYSDDTLDLNICKALEEIDKSFSDSANFKADGIAESLGEENVMLSDLLHNIELEGLDDMSFTGRQKLEVYIPMNKEDANNAISNKMSLLQLKAYEDIELAILKAKRQGINGILTIEMNISNCLNTLSLSGLKEIQKFYNNSYSGLQLSDEVLIENLFKQVKKYSSARILWTDKERLHEKSNLPLKCVVYYYIHDSECISNVGEYKSITEFN